MAAKRSSITRRNLVAASAAIVAALATKPAHAKRRLLREATGVWPNAVKPIKVTRSALGVNTPHSDLFLSPGHALYLDGLLIQVNSLVNGRTIVRQAPDEADALEYFQIELFDHDILYANGAAAETLFAVSTARRRCCCETCDE